MKGSCGFDSRLTHKQQSKQNQMNNGEEIPQVATSVMNVNKMGYHLTNAQMSRRRRGQSIYERDRKVKEYKYSNGEWV